MGDVTKVIITNPAGDQEVAVVIAAPPAGTPGIPVYPMGGGGIPTGVTIADGADVAEGSTTDVPWAGTGADPATVIALLKKLVSGGGSAVSIADGSDVAEGATTDAAVVTDVAGTVSGKLRGLVKIFASVWDSVAGLLHIGTVDLNTSGTINGVNQTVDLVLTGVATVVFQPVFAAFSGTFAFQGSADGGTTFTSVRSFIEGVGWGTQITALIGSGFLVRIPAAGLTHVRIKCTAFTSGSATVNLRGSRIGTTTVTRSPNNLIDTDREQVLLYTAAAGTALTDAGGDLNVAIRQLNPLSGAARINTQGGVIGTGTQRVVIATDQPAFTNPVPVTGTVATGGLTDVQLRATPVPVSGPLTDAQLRDGAPRVVTALIEHIRTQVGL